jgi:hypothetical protein
MPLRYSYTIVGPELSDSEIILLQLFVSIVEMDVVLMSTTLRASSLDENRSRQRRLWGSSQHMLFTDASCIIIM